MMNKTDYQYDVIILGTGLAGTMLGSILAKNGFRVLLLDASAHPRFAIGESTIGYTLIHLRLLAERYGIPEIQNLSNLPDALRATGSSSGLKKHFGFIIHRDGREPDPRETNQFRIPKVLNQAPHYFRQDTDAYMFHAAIRYGCVARQNCRVEKVDLASDGVTAIAEDGSVYHGRFIVDGSGFRSPLAQQLNIREEPTRLRHHARSIFTHMTGVERTDDHIHFPKKDQPPVPWHEGTMHHMFDRGWIWVIPFDNHERSTNPLCSVGLQLDPRRYPIQSDLTAEEEFRYHVSRFPAVERQLRNARTVREWVRTGRMQYSATQTVGHRWCLMSHAAGFIDPLFSRGLSNTCEIVNTLAWRLMEALRDDDFAVDRLKHVERLEQGLLDYNDSVVNSAYISFAHYPLWNAVFRIWAYGSLPGARRVLHAMTLSRKAGDDGYLRRLEDVPNPGLWWPNSAAYKDLYDEMTAYCEAVDDGTMDPGDAAERLHRRIAAADWIAPSLGFQRPEERFINPTRPKLAQMAVWATTKGPQDMREYMASTTVNVLKTSALGKRLF